MELRFDEEALLGGILRTLEEVRGAAVMASTKPKEVSSPHPKKA